MKNGAARAAAMDILFHSRNSGKHFDYIMALSTCRDRFIYHINDKTSPKCVKQRFVFCSTSTVLSILSFYSCILFILSPAASDLSLLAIFKVILTLFFLYIYISPERWWNEVLMIGSGLIRPATISPKATTVCREAFKPHSHAVHISVFGLSPSIMWSSEAPSCLMRPISGQ